MRSRSLTIRQFTHSAAAAMLLVASLSAGCQRSDTVPAGGTVTLDGQPAENAEVIFMPKKGRVASGVTDASGRFSLSTNKDGDGAVLGEHAVVVGEYYPPGKPPPMSGGPPPRFPQKYTDAVQSPLRVTVERGKTNDFKFELTK